jgi:ACS family hexuronate transporter-like MFS transporter
MTNRSATWKWSVCGLLLLATMLNYMDRQTLAQTATDIQRELGLNDAQYGTLEFGFGLAFAAGALVIGFVADRIPILLLYPLVLIGWSLAGYATSHASEIGRATSSLTGAQTESEMAFWGFLLCRVTLGFFEAGQWPCALVTTSRILNRAERSLGNSILQSGASIGAILTPQVVKFMGVGPPGTWALPFQAIGLIGMVWIVPWFLLVRPGDLAPSTVPDAQPEVDLNKATLPPDLFRRRFAACLIAVICINLMWQFFRAWLPKFLREYHDYEAGFVQDFTSAYYISTDIGCISVGILVRWLAARRWDVHTARVTTFAGCAGLTALAVPVAFLPRGPLLLGTLLVIGAASLGLFPNYYSFSQDLSSRHQGKVTGTLGAITWIASAIMQQAVGIHINNTKSYQAGIIMAGLAPVVAALAIIVLWKPNRSAAASASPELESAARMSPQPSTAIREG